MQLLIKSRSWLAVLFQMMMIASCSKDEIDYSITGIPYAEGIRVIDLVTLNDCTLPACSDQRIRRLEIDKVVGFISGDSTLQVNFTFDSVIQFHVCNMEAINLDFKSHIGAKVIFSGIAKDGCGYLYSIFPVEEEYFINLTKIQFL